MTKWLAGALVTAVVLGLGSCQCQPSYDRQLWRRDYERPRWTVQPMFSDSAFYTLSSMFDDDWYSDFHRKPLLPDTHIYTSCPHSHREDPSSSIEQISQEQVRERQMRAEEIKRQQRFEQLERAERSLVEEKRRRAEQYKKDEEALEERQAEIRRLRDEMEGNTMPEENGSVQMTRQHQIEEMRQRHIRMTEEQKRVAAANSKLADLENQKMTERERLRTENERQARLEQERQAKLEAEQEHQASLRREQERQARQRAEAERQAKLRMDQQQQQQAKVMAEKERRARLQAEQEWQEEQNQREKLRAEQARQARMRDAQRMRGDMRREEERLRAEPHDSVNIATHKVAGYDPDDITLQVSGNRVKMEGKHICTCTESCITREFVRGYPLPNNVDPDSITATLDAQGDIRIQGRQVRNTHGDLQHGDIIVKVQGLGIPQSTKPSSDELRKCLGQKGGIKLNKVNKSTGRAHVEETYKYDHEVEGSEVNRSTDIHEGGHSEESFDFDDGSYVEIEDYY